jgi:hypothetical protein
MRSQNKARLVVIGGLIIFFAAAGTARAQNIVKNGSFEKPFITTPDGWFYNRTDAKWNAYASSPAFLSDLAWIVEWRADVQTWINDHFTQWGLPAPAAQLELQGTGVYGPKGKPDDGLQWAELDADWTGPYAAAAPDPPYRGGPPGNTKKPGSISIYQHLSTLPGTYELSFAFAPRPGTGTSFAGQWQNQLEVKWNDTALEFSGAPYIAAVPPAATTDPIVWTSYKMTVQALGTDTELRFTDLGYSDSFGTLLDSVIVTRIGDGCTRTLGYWKTHSIYGPASHEDATWSKVGPLGPDTVFFNTPYTWYGILNMAPKGNPYLILAHQYIAAYLNLLSGSSAWKGVSYDDLYNAMATAKSLLGLSMNVAKNQRQQYTSIAGFLTDYNEGVIGPGHCFDETAQTSSIGMEDGSLHDDGGVIR